MALLEGKAAQFALPAPELPAEQSSFVVEPATRRPVTPPDLPVQPADAPAVVLAPPPLPEQPAPASTASVAAEALPQVLTTSAAAVPVEQSSVVPGVPSQAESVGEDSQPLPAKEAAEGSTSAAGAPDGSRLGTESNQPLGSNTQQESIAPPADSRLEETAGSAAPPTAGTPVSEEPAGGATTSAGSGLAENRSTDAAVSQASQSKQGDLLSGVWSSAAADSNIERQGVALQLAVQEEPRTEQSGAAEQAVSPPESGSSAPGSRESASEAAALAEPAGAAGPQLDLPSANSVQPGSLAVADGSSPVTVATPNAATPDAPPPAAPSADSQNRLDAASVKLPEASTELRAAEVAISEGPIQEESAESPFNRREPE